MVSHIVPLPLDFVKGWYRLFCAFFHFLYILTIKFFRSEY